MTGFFIFFSRKALRKRFDPAPPSAIEEAQSRFRPREAAGNKQCCGFFKTSEEEELPKRRRERGREAEREGREAG